MRIQTWFVTGASSGVGNELCRQLLFRGYNVIAISRKKALNLDHPNCLLISADVTKVQDIKFAISAGITRFGSIDVLSNNAGLSANILLEDETSEHMRTVMETNFWGSYNTMKEFILLFRNQGYGSIINNTSQSGISCRKFGAAYVASKHALEGLTSVAWLETQNFCRVMAVELGFFKNTNIYNSSKTVKNYKKEYSDIPDFYKKFNRNFNNNLELAVKFLIDQAEKKDLPRRLILGKDALIKIDAEVEWIRKDLQNSKYRALACSGIKKHWLINYFMKDRL